VNKALFIKHSFANQSFKPHFHNHYSIGLILQGEHKLYINEDKALIAQNELKIINPNELHFAEKNSRWSYINLLLEQKKVQAIAKTIYGKVDRAITFKTKINNAKLSSHFLRLYESFGRSAFEEELIEFVEQLLLNYSYCNQEPIIFDGNIFRALEFIYERFLDDISIDDIAKVAGFSKYHTIKLFKKKLALTPHQYILRLRVEEAIKLIKKGLPLVEVAYHCGFSDQSHFIKEFKKIYGIAPSHLIC